jgi:hypothetical protein
MRERPSVKKLLAYEKEVNSKGLPRRRRQDIAFHRHAADANDYAAKDGGKIVES